MRCLRELNCVVCCVYTTSSCVVCILHVFKKKAQVFKRNHHHHHNQHQHTHTRSRARAHAIFQSHSKTNKTPDLLWLITLTQVWFSVWNTPHGLVSTESWHGTTVSTSYTLFASQQSSFSWQLSVSNITDPRATHISCIRPLLLHTAEQRMPTGAGHWHEMMIENLWPCGQRQHGYTLFRPCTLHSFIVGGLANTVCFCRLTCTRAGQYW